MQRFWDKVIIDDQDHCWTWTAGLRGKTGYGAIKYNKKVYDSHRFAWYLTYGVFPKLFVLHKCDNRLCVNPKHLYEGTARDNVRDMWQRGRQARHMGYGSANLNSKLTELQVTTMRQQHATGNFTFAQLARDYGIDRTNVEDICKHKAWRHIP